MGSLLEFRPPQFSEEVAWLPAWLQEHRLELFDEQIKQAQNIPEQSLKIVSTGNDMNLSHMDEDKYKNYHLFLSGEDNSAASLASSTGNVLHFNLLLLGDSASEYVPSLLPDALQAGKNLCSKTFLAQKTEVAAGQEQMGNKFRVDPRAGAKVLPPFGVRQDNSECVCSQSLLKDKETENKHEEIAKYLKLPDVNEAIELSIQASEALVIHDIMKSSSSTKNLAASTALEVALRMKQARLDCSGNNFHGFTEDINEIDHLSDLNDSDTADAFEDVGLLVSCPNDWQDCALIISEVEDTPHAEDHNGFNDENEYGNHGLLDVGCDDIAIKQSTGIPDMDKQEANDFLGEDDVVRNMKSRDNQLFVSNNSSMSSHCGSLVYCSVLAHADVEAAPEAVGSAMENVSSFHPQARANLSPQDWNCVNCGERDDRQKVAGPHRFQSRWLGGWMWKKETNASALVETKNAKVIPEFLVVETSYLSESGDIVPDENSFVQKEDKEFNKDSQSSMPSDGLYNRAEEHILLSQDIMKSSLSSIDPLCSVVPCSISSENVCYTLGQIPDDEANARKCIRSSPENFDVDMQKTSNLNAELVQEDWQTVRESNGDGSQPAVHRQLTTLRSYSTLLPPGSGFMERDSVNCSVSLLTGYSSGFLSAKQSMWSNRGSTGLQPLKPMHMCSTVGERKENHQALLSENPVLDLMIQERNNDEGTKVGIDLQAPMKKYKCSPLILNQGTYLPFPAFQGFISDLSAEKNRERHVIPRGDNELPQSRNLKREKFKHKVACGTQGQAENLQLNCKVAHDTEVQKRKRVCFLETNILLTQKKNLQRLHSSHRDCSRAAARTGRCMRNSKEKFSQREAREVKRCRTGFKDKACKRLIFQGLEFLLTGFSRKKEKEIEGLIRKYGGIVLFDIPSHLKGKRNSRLKRQQLPIVLCLKKLETTKFLYGCAVNAYVLKVNWLTDSIAAGSALPPEKYMIISNNAGEKCITIGRTMYRNSHTFIFDGVGIMLHGKHSFCTRLAQVFKHGGGQVFKTLGCLVQNLDTAKISVGAIVAEDESRASRHLKHYASERNISTMPASWIINSLHAGRLLPLVEKKHSSHLPALKTMEFPAPTAFSEEI